MGDPSFNVIQDESYWRETCKIGQGEQCCRYLVSGTQGIECAKINLELKKQIDKKVESGTYLSKGDNCNGWWENDKGN